MEDYFKTKNPCIIYLNHGINSDSGLSPDMPIFDFMKNYNQNMTDLFSVITESRVVKSLSEIEILKYIV